MGMMELEKQFAPPPPLAPQVSRFHAFGAQLFMCADGVFTAREMKGRREQRASRPGSGRPGFPAGKLRVEVSGGDADGAASVGKGPFAHHRMLAYRCEG